MLQGFWGGATLSAANQAVVFLALGGLAGPILVVRKLALRGEARAAAVTAAVHAAAAPGTLRVAGITRLGAESPWRAAGRLEALGMELERGQQWRTEPVREAGMKSYRVTVDGQAFEVTVEELRGTKASPRRIAPPPVLAPLSPPRPAAQAVRAPATGERPIPAPLSGKILAVNVVPGDTVTEGTVLLILEAMKMENDILAPAGGTVKAVKVQNGDTVKTGDLLVILE
ncbi:MAG: biotin/lipoyl-containing protein [candidate division NC10 bacterium]